MGTGRAQGAPAAILLPLLLPLALLVGLVLGGCSSGHPTTTSRTPRITVGGGTPLAAALLSATDLRGVPGLPGDVGVTPLTNLKVYEDPDPRAPCGAHVPSLNLSGAAGVGIKSTTVQGAELAVGVGPPSPRTYFDALVADTRAGCPAYQTTTNTGAVQTVTLRTVVALPPLADGALAVNLGIQQGDHGTLVTLVAVRQGDALALTTLFTAAPLTDGTVRALATAIAHDLAKPRR